MNNRLLLALPLALVFSAGAFANDSDSGTNSGAVEKLKASLTNISGFEVLDTREAGDGTTCITYQVSNDQNGTSKSHAVVQGDKVLRETTGNTRFAKAWNSKCVASR
jgi:flavin-binding protein dodecin